MYSVTVKNGRRYLTFVAEKKDEGREVLGIMRQDLSLSARKIKSVKYYEEGIFLDGIRVNVRQRVHEGQCLMVLLEDVTRSCTELIGFHLDLKVLYEDEDLIFIEKPSGWVCHPSQGHYADSLANAVCTYLRGRGETASIHLLGRLDKDTSGIVGFAKNSVVQEQLERQRQEGLFYKEYLALVHGIPEKENGYIYDSIMEVISEDGRHAHMVTTEEEAAKAAETYYETEVENRTASLCRVYIKTGRTHQIRIHMSNNGNPLLGDELYGGKCIMGIKRAALHAERVCLEHPITGESIELKADIPEDMKIILAVIEKEGKILK